MDLGYIIFSNLEYLKCNSYFWFVGKNLLVLEGFIDIVYLLRYFIFVLKISRVKLI